MRKKNEGKLAVIMVLALIAFVAGSAVGITVSISEHEVVNDTNTSHVENVTVEMLNKSNQVNNTTYYEESDAVDFNNASSMQQDLSELEQYEQYEYV